MRQNGGRGKTTITSQKIEYLWIVPRWLEKNEIDNSLKKILNRELLWTPFSSPEEAYRTQQPSESARCWLIINNKLMWPIGEGGGYDREEKA